MVENDIPGPDVDWRKYRANLPPLICFFLRFYPLCLHFFLTIILIFSHRFLYSYYNFLFLFCEGTVCPYMHREWPYKNGQDFLDIWWRIWILVRQWLTNPKSLVIGSKSIQVPRGYIGKTHGFYTRWLLISLCAHMEQIRHFDLLKAVGYIKRVMKSDFFRKRTLFTSYVHNVK